MAGWDQLSEVIDALAPDASVSNFPYPRLVQSTGAGGSFTAEGPLINGRPMPGQWLLAAADRTYEMQEQKGLYITGARLLPVNLPLAHIKYAIRIWTSADAGVYRKLLGTLFKNPFVNLPATQGLSATVSVAALAIEDPSLRDIGVTAVAVNRVTPLLNPLVTSGGKGPWTAEAEFIEFRSPGKPMQAPADQAIPDAGEVTPSAYNLANQESANLAQGQRDLQNAAARQLLGRG